MARTPSWKDQSEVFQEVVSISRWGLQNVVREGVQTEGPHTLIKCDCPLLLATESGLIPQRTLDPEAQSNRVYKGKNRKIRRGIHGC